MEMGEMSEDGTWKQLTLSVEASPARTSVLLEAVQGWLESEAGSGLSLYALLRRLSLSGLLSKTSPVCCPLGVPLNRRLARWKYETSVQKKKLEDGRIVWRVSGMWKRKAILKPSSLNWSNSAIASPTGCLTLNFGEFPSDAGVCSLWQILEQEVPKKYYLSPRAARGILRRAERRGRGVPPQLKRALPAGRMGG